MEHVGIALVGLGTVGSGVAKLLLEQPERLAARAGKRLELKRVVVRDPAKPRSAGVPRELITNDLSAVVKDPEISLAAHLVGGLEPARSILLALLEAGKDVVTANKAVVSEHGPELFDAARRLGRAIAFEAAVGGGIPIIAALSESLAANQVLEVSGILNGTSNFILTEMLAHRKAYPVVLRRAQQLGYAEADPSMDVNGSDAAQKLAILAQLAFGARVHMDDVPRLGIEGIELIDLSYADELGYRIKLLAVARLVDGELELHVAPTLVRTSTPIAQVAGPYNAIEVVGDAVGHTIFYGSGAGQMPTASAVMADLIGMAVGRAQLTFRTLRLWSEKPSEGSGSRSPASERSRASEGRVPVAIKPSDELTGRYYLRFTVEDRPGVLAEIAGVLGRHGISIASVIQHEAPEHGARAVPLVFMTHLAREGDVLRACAEADRLASVRPPSVRMRVQG